jgi:hypothetical protein
MDLSAAMIELLHAAVDGAPKLRRHARLTTFVGDMSAFASERRFAAIVLGTTSVTLLSAAQRAACFACVRDHLAPGGRFLVTALDVAATEPDESVAALPGEPPALLYEYVDPAAGRRWTSVLLIEEPRAIFTSAPALLPSAVLEAELERAGLPVLARHPVAGGAPGHWLRECGS